MTIELEDLEPIIAALSGLAEKREEIEPFGQGSWRMSREEMVASLHSRTRQLFPARHVDAAPKAAPEGQGKSQWKTWCDDYVSDYFEKPTLNDLPGFHDHQGHGPLHALACQILGSSQPDYHGWDSDDVTQEQATTFLLAAEDQHWYISEVAEYVRDHLAWVEGDRNDAAFRRRRRRMPDSGASSGNCSQWRASTS